MPSVFGFFLCLLCLCLPVNVAPQSSDDLTVTVIPQSQWYFRGEELSLLATSRHADLRIEGWVHNGSVLQSTSRHVISAIGTGRSTLRIPTLEPGDGGVYTVVARDAEGTEHRKSSDVIQLLYPAVINAAPKQYIVENSTNVLNCSSPNSTVIIWLFEGSVLELAANSASYTQLQDGRLQISNTGLTHTGVYTCEVYVEMYGKRWTKDITLEIIVKPSPVASITPSPSSTTLTLQWTITASTNRPVDHCNIYLHGGGSEKMVVYIPTSQVSTNITVEHVIEDLVPDVLYSVRVSPVNGAGEGVGREIQVNTLPAVPLITMATTTGYNTTAIQLAVVFKYRGSSRPISLRVTFANVDTQSSQTVTYRNITVKDLEWRTVISGLDFNLFTFTVVAVNDVGGSGAVTTQPSYPKPVTSSAPVISLLSGTWSQLTISVTVSNLGVPPISRVVLNMTSPGMTSQCEELTGRATPPVTVVFTLTDLDAFTDYEVVAYGSNSVGPGEMTQEMYNTSFVQATAGIVIGAAILLVLLGGAVAIVIYVSWWYFKKRGLKSHQFHTAKVVGDTHLEPASHVSTKSTKELYESPGNLRRGMVVANVNSTCTSVVSEQTIRSPPHSHVMLLPREEKIMELFDDEELKTPDSVKMASSLSYQCSTFV